MFSNSTKKQILHFEGVKEKSIRANFPVEKYIPKNKNFIKVVPSEICLQSKHFKYK